MSAFKRFMGLVWIALALFVLYMMVSQSTIELAAAKKATDAAKIVDTKIFWYSILPIFLPLVFGMGLFGYFALKGEYNEIPRDSAHLQ
jgi:hypothetical protein